MSLGIFEIILYIIIGFVALIVIGISYLTFRIIKKKTSNKWIQSISLLPIVVFSYYLYRAFVPGNSFYEGHFKSVTGFDYPENGKVIFGNISSVDEFGDGTYTSLHQVEKEMIQKLPNALIKKNYEEVIPTNNYEFEDDYDEIISEFKHEEIGEYINVAILKDSSSVYIQINQW